MAFMLYFICVIPDNILLGKKNIFVLQNQRYL